MKIEFFNKVILGVLLLSIVVVIVATAHKFLIKEDYDFTVESPCDPLTDACYYRDCSTGECPPNELEYYKVFSIGAHDFFKCSDDLCAQECMNASISCEESVCDESAGDECAVIETSNQI